jgi:hypothetical protein
VVTQAGGQYTVQPATAAQGAVQHLKTAYGLAQPLSAAASAASAAVPQQAAPAVGAMGQVLVQGSGGLMYAAAPSSQGGTGMHAGSDAAGMHGAGAGPQGIGGPQYAMQSSYTPGGVMAPAMGAGAGSQLLQAAPGVAGPGGGGPQGGGVGGAPTYQVAPSAGLQLPGSAVVQSQAADPVAYAKLAGYGQQGAAPLTAAPRTQHPLLYCTQHCRVPAVRCALLCRRLQGKHVTVLCDRGCAGPDVRHACQRPHGHQCAVRVTRRALCCADERLTVLDCPQCTVCGPEVMPSSTGLLFCTGAPLPHAACHWTPCQACLGRAACSLRTASSQAALRALVPLRCVVPHLRAH